MSAFHTKPTSRLFLALCRENVNSYPNQYSLISLPVTILGISLIERQYTQHNFALPALATDYVHTPVVAAYFSVG